MSYRGRSKSSYSNRRRSFGKRRTYPPSQYPGYDGMNSLAAKELGFPFPYPENIVVTRAGLPSGRRKRTIKHEQKELKLMKQGLSYKQAHAKVLLEMKDVSISELDVPKSEVAKEQRLHPTLPKEVVEQIAADNVAQSNANG